MGLDEPMTHDDLDYSAHLFQQRRDPIFADNLV
jgi:hypothetical protein